MKVYSIKHKPSGRYYSGYINDNCTVCFDEDDIKTTTNQEDISNILYDINVYNDVYGISGYRFYKEDFVIVEFDVTEKEIID